MLHIREWRSRLALVWLLCQVASVALAAGSLPHGAALAARVTTCTCPGDHTDGACPMHQAGASDESDDCTMRSARVTIDAALLSLVTGLGIPSVSSIAIGPASTHAIHTAVSADTGVTDIPDAPPPRA